MIIIVTFFSDIFDQISSSKGFIDKNRLRVFIKDALQVRKNVLVVYMHTNTRYGRLDIEKYIHVYALR